MATGQRAYWSVSEFAKEFGFTTKTIYKYITAGSLPAIRLGPDTNGVPWRIADETVQEFRNKRTVHRIPKRPKASGGCRENGESA